MYGSDRQLDVIKLSQNEPRQNKAHQKLNKLNITPMRLHNVTVITPSTNVHNLGVTFDNELSMNDQVNHITRSCFYQLRQLRFIRNSLPTDTAKLLVHAFASSRVNYSNSLLYGITTRVMCKLQAV